MSNAGYGNHDDVKPGSAEAPDPKAASAKPGAGSTDRPGMDLGGAGDLSGASGQMAGIRSNPDPTGTGPHSGAKDSTSPTLSDDDRRDVSTPGDGAGVGRGQAGSDADPGVG